MKTTKNVGKEKIFILKYHKRGSIDNLPSLAYEMIDIASEMVNKLVA